MTCQESGTFPKSEVSGDQLNDEFATHPFLAFRLQLTVDVLHFCFTHASFDFVQFRDE